MLRVLLMSAHAIVGIRPAMLSGDASDPIDRLMTVTCGEVLQLPGDECSGGEYDSFAAGAVSARVRRRLAGARLVSSHGGLRADELQQVAELRLPALGGMNPDQFVAWYVAECVAGLDHRAAGRDGVVRWEDQTEPDPDDELEPMAAPAVVGPQRVHRAPSSSSVDLGPGVAPCADDALSIPGAPGWFVAWVLRTVHPPKVALLAELGRWAWANGPRPVLPGDAWVPALLVKFERRSGVTL